MKRGNSMHRFMVLILFGGLALAQTSTSPATPGADRDTGVAPTLPAENPASPAAQPAAPVSPSAGSMPPAISAPANAVKSPASQTSRERELQDPLLDLPPVPRQKLSLIGGRVIKIDRILDELQIQPFGGKKTHLAFDVRTQVFRDGAKASAKDIRPGDRIYADTQLDASRRVFARSIRVVTQAADAVTGTGQVVSYDPGDGTMTLQDELIPRPVKLHVTPQTVIRKNQSAGSVADLQPGSLVAVNFAPGSRIEAREITVLAVPGATFTFSGPITHLDLSTHLLAVANKSDNKTYDIEFDPARVGESARNIKEGSEVTVDATFNGKTYVAGIITIHPEAQK